MADIPEDSDDEHGSRLPRTPPQRRARPASYRPHRRDSSDASIHTTHLSPPASPSISPYSLGMSPLSPLRRQFSPPTLAPSSPLYPHSDSDHRGLDYENHEDITQDSRDVLVQRLNDLVARLSQERHGVQDENIHALHAKVDELENVLDTRAYPVKARHDSQDRSNLSWEPPGPANLLPSDVSSLASSTHPSPSAKAKANKQAKDTETEQRASNLTVVQAEQIVAEVQDLHKNLEVVISNLRDRQEETEHIHALLITRLERAAQRIIYLEEQLANLEREQKDDNTELLNLQIQLKAIEVQCMSYVPQGADQELSESIGAWKMEYSALKQRRARNREQYNGTPTRRRAAG
ncbi:hypothetical protein F5Y09DRAFT_58308 [Xylaria sp. FL1042]|nr:hypothetical protein F5Y09DRAFT_58308 [Xylaria sp. FL1042]